MSLISEALRKARQEAAEREANEVRSAGGGPVAPQAGRGRFGAGLVMGAIIAVAAAMIGAGVVWWWVSSRGGAPAETGATAEARNDFEPRDVAGSDAGAYAMREHGVQAASTAVASVGSEVPTAPPAVNLGGSGDSTKIGEAAGPESTGVSEGTNPDREVIAGTRARDFLVHADLGYAVLTLDYIVFREHDPYAQINGREAHVGSVIEGFAVLEVARASVLLEDDRGELLLRVR